MERLTKVNGRGGYFYPDCFKKCHGAPIYENCQECSIENKICQKLADYEDAEENGLLVRLPCKPGDTVYVIYCGYVTSAKVMAVYIDCIGGMFDLKIKANTENSIVFENIIDGDNYAFNDIGKTVFLNREEAEQALEEDTHNESD
ncbi:MAG: hypothetical protein MRZ66_04945 [Clostridiales bacterium]|nr:hypothetical protein [Clostridiales bacterium]